MGWLCLSALHFGFRCACFYTRRSSKAETRKLYAAFIEYGWDGLTFQVLEICKPDKELILALEQEHLNARP